MAQFFWKAHTDGNRMCIACMSQENARGFVDFVSDVTIMRDERTATGVADVWLCANCLEQSARMVGSATKDETMDLAHTVMEKDEEIERLKGEVQAWQQRVFQLANLDLEDFADLSKLKAERDKNESPPSIG